MKKIRHARSFTFSFHFLNFDFYLIGQTFFKCQFWRPAPVIKHEDDCISGDGRHMKTKASLTSAKIDTNQNSLSLSVTSTTDVPSRFYADKSSVTNRSHANFRTTRRSMSQITTTNTRRPIAIRPKRSSSSPRRLEELMTIKSCVIKTPVYTTQYDPINPSCHSWPNNPERYARARLQFAKIARNNSGKLKF